MDYSLLPCGEVRALTHREDLQHVMVRGIERRPLFRDDRDRDDFVARCVRLAEQEAQEAARPWRQLNYRWCRNE